MDISISPPERAPIPNGEAHQAERPLWTAIGRGIAHRCPCCGRGGLYRAYLKPKDNCDECGLEFSGHRADDLPPYLTILIAGHVLVPALVALERIAPPPLWATALFWSSAAILLCLALLPRVKGAVIGLQWALEMHGFARENTERGDRRIAAPDRVSDPEADLG